MWRRIWGVVGPLTITCRHTHNDSPEDSMQRGQGTFRPDKKEDRHTCYRFIAESASERILKLGSADSFRVFLFLVARDSLTDSSTDVFLDDATTLLTLDVAAPVKLAVASLDHSAPANVESAPAAHKLAAVDAARRPAAAATVRAERPGPAVRLAEVRRVSQVDEVGVGRRLELIVPRHQFASRPAHQSLLDLRSVTTLAV